MDSGNSTIGIEITKRSAAQLFLLVLVAGFTTQSNSYARQLDGSVGKTGQYSIIGHVADSKDTLTTQLFTGTREAQSVTKTANTAPVVDFVRGITDAFTFYTRTGDKLVVLATQTQPTNTTQFTLDTRSILIKQNPTTDGEGTLFNTGIQHHTILAAKIKADGVHVFTRQQCAIVNDVRYSWTVESVITPNPETGGFAVKDLAPTSVPTECMGL